MIDCWVGRYSGRSAEGYSWHCTAHLASRPWKLKIKNRSSRFKNVPHMWMKQSWVRWDNYQPILFSPICCNWFFSQVKIFRPLCTAVQRPSFPIPAPGIDISSQDGAGQAVGVPSYTASGDMDPVNSLHCTGLYSPPHNIYWPNLSWRPENILQCNNRPLHNYPNELHWNY